MRVLVGIDGSAQAWEALRMLATLSPCEEILLVHAVDPALPAMAAGAEVYVSYLPDLEKALRERGESLLAEAQGRLPERTEVKRLLLVGSAADAILSTAETEMVELIVVGARGLGRLSELMLGSVSHRVLYHATCPVMVVHGTARAAVRRVLAPVHGEEDGERLVHFLSKKPFPVAVEIRVLQVLPVADPLWPLDALRDDQRVRAAIDKASEATGAVAQSLVKLGHRAVGAVGLGAASDSILREVDSFAADLILMSARSRSGASRFLLGSVSHAVVHRAPCPVVILR